MQKLQRLLLITDIFFQMSGALLAPFYALFVEKVHGDLLDASTTSAVFLLTAGVVIYLLSRWEDRSHHQRKFLILGYGICVLGYLGYLFVSSPFTLFIVQIVLGLSVAFKNPAYDSLYSESVKKHITLAWGEWEAMNYVVYGVGALAGGIIANSFGFTALLSVMLALSVISFVISLLFLRKNRFPS